MKVFEELNHPGIVWPPFPSSFFPMLFRFIPFPSFSPSFHDLFQVSCPNAASGGGPIGTGLSSVQSSSPFSYLAHRICARESSKRKRADFSR